jgi:histidine ammonia-lyase
MKLFISIPVFLKEMLRNQLLARKLREIVRNTEHVIAIEILCGAQAMDLFTNMKPGEGTLIAYKIIRDEIPHLEKDRIISKDIETMVHLMRSGKILKEVEKVVGKLN